MPHVPGHNPFYSFQKGGTPQSIPSTSNLLPPPQPATSIEQVAQADPPRKERGGFFDPLITKETVQSKVPGKFGTVLGTAAEFTTSPFDIALLPTWAVGGPAISGALKGAKVLAHFPKGLKWFPKVLGSIFDPFPGTVTSLPMRLIAETGATIGGGVVGTEAAEYGEDLGGLPGAIIGGLGGGLVGGTVGGLGTVGVMQGSKGLSKVLYELGVDLNLLKRGVTRPKDTTAIYKMMQSQKYFPTPNETQENLRVEIERTLAQAEQEDVLPSDIWVKKKLGKRQLYYKPPKWVEENLPELANPTIRQQLLPLLEKTNTSSALDFRTIEDFYEDPYDLQIDTVADLDKLIMPSIDTKDIVNDIEVATSEVAGGRLGRSIDKLPRPVSNVLTRIHRLGNPMSKSQSLMEVLGSAKNIGEKNAGIAAMKLYEWTGLWKMDEVFGETDKTIWVKNETGQDVGNIKVGTLKDGGELKEAAKAAGIFNAENLSVLRILEETRPSEGRWYSTKKGGVIDKSRDYRNILNDEQKEVLRRIDLANEYSQVQLRKFGIRTGTTFRAKSQLEQEDIFAFTQDMLDDAAEEMRLNPDISAEEKELFDQDVNYANRRIIMHKKTNDIAIIGREDRVWKLGKKIGAEYSRQFNRITAAEAKGYVYMPLDSAFVIGMTSKHKRALYQSMSKYLKESIEKQSYEEYKDIEIISLKDRTNELLYREMQKERPHLSDEKVRELIERSMNGDLDALPEQIIMRDNAQAVLPVIREIRKRLKAGESIKGLAFEGLEGDGLNAIKQLFAIYPAKYFKNQGIDISDLFDDKDGLNRLQGLKENNFENKTNEESFNKIMKELKIENEEEAEFLVTLAWARRTMGDETIMNGGKIKNIDLDKIKEVLDGVRTGTKEDAEELRKLINTYKDSVSKEGIARQAALKSQIDDLTNLYGDIIFKQEARDDSVEFGFISQMNELQARYDENSRLQFIYNRYGSEQRLDFIDEDFRLGLKYKKDGFDAIYTKEVFAKEQANLLNENVPDDVAVQAEDLLNSYNEFIDGALIKGRTKINYDADPKKLDEALSQLMELQYTTLNGIRKTIINIDGNKQMVETPGVIQLIENAEIRAKKNLDDVIFLEQPELDEYIFRTSVDAEQGAHDTLLKMRSDFEAIFKQVDPSSMSAWWTGVNAVQRMIALGFDASIFMIQLFPVMMNHPTIMPRVFKGYFKALWKTWQDPDAGARMMFEYRAKPENEAVLRKYGRYLLMSEDNEVFDLLATGKIGEIFQQKVQQPGRVGGVARAGQRFGGGFKNAFDHVLDIAGIEIAKAMDGIVDGTNPELVDKQIKAVADYANGMRGLFSSQAAGVSSVQRYKEAQWMLAARYRRAVASLYAMALSPDPARSKLAQTAMVNLATGTIMSAVALQMMGSYVDGDNEEEIFDKVEKLLDPRSGGFLMFQAGGQSVGIGSKFVSDSKFIGKALTFMWKKGTGGDVEEWQDFLTMERTNPGLQWVRAQMAYAPITAWGIFSGRDYVGEPVFRPGESNFDSITNFVEPLSEAAIPIWMSSTFFEAGGKSGDWAGQGLRGFSELFGMRTHPQSTSEILRLASYDYMDMPFDQMEPFQKDLLRHMLTDDLTHLQEEQVKQGSNDFALYFNNIRRIEKEYQDGLIELTKIHPPTKEGNRNMYTAYRGLKSFMRGQKKERGYEIEFNNDSLEDENPNTRALGEYWALYDKATLPGTEVIDWDIWQVEYDKLMMTLTLEQQTAVARNSHDLPMPPEFMQRLASVGLKEYNRIMIAQKLREDYFRSIGKDDLAEKMRKYHLMLED